MTSPQPQMRQWRGVVQFAPNDHELFALVQNRVKLGWAWGQIASEIGCSVNDLLHWVNHVYTSKELPKTNICAPSSVAKPADLPKDSPALKTKQFMAWRRQREGARAALEAIEREKVANG